MKILIIGGGRRVDELRSCLPSGHEIAVAARGSATSAGGFDVLFDTTFDRDPPFAAAYEGFKGVAVVSAVNKRLVEVIGTAIKECKLVGMNMIPTFITRELKEWTFLDDPSRKAGETLSADLDWKFTEVRDQVGMVTPRILFQIINEACWVLHEGIASIGDIDSAMKLGTNYPHGPFEWADKVGLEEIVATLTALSRDDPARYRVCPLLEGKYFRGETFYPAK
jgi:3-hydroxybutyryl-CoA dehydrogenase